MKLFTLSLLIVLSGCAHGVKIRPGRPGEKHDFYLSVHGSSPLHSIKVYTYPPAVLIWKVSTDSYMPLTYFDLGVVQEDVMKEKLRVDKHLNPNDFREGQILVVFLRYSYVSFFPPALSSGENMSWYRWNGNTFVCVSENDDTVRDFYKSRLREE